MLETIYPQEEQRAFTDREYLLALLGLSRDLLLQGTRKHLALTGFRRVGKTLVLKEFIKRLIQENRPDFKVVYIDLPRLSLAPERFALQYIGYHLYWLSRTGEQRPESFFEPSMQLAAAGRLGEEDAISYLAQFHHELEKEKPDQHFLIEMAFNFVEVFSQANHHKTMVIIDEFPELLALNNYPQIRDIVALFRAVLQSQNHVCYVVAGSMMSLMERIFLQSESPLFVHFQVETVYPLSRQDNDELVQKRLSILDQPVPKDVMAAVYEMSQGHPYYTYAICLRLIEFVSLQQRGLNPTVVKEAFTLEILESTGRIYNLCCYIFEHSLKNVRGETIPETILQIIAKEPGRISVTSIANKLKRPTGAVHQVLSRLQEVDLIEQFEDKTYAFRDRILQIWVAYYYSGVQLTGLPSQKVLNDLVAELMEKYEQSSSELGLAKESQVRELLLRFNGQVVPGNLFGGDGMLQLPVIHSAGSYRSGDGQLEVDALAEGNERWVVEVKWRNKQVGLKEMQKLHQNANQLAGRPWMISRTGFTPDAVEYAQSNEILFSSRSQVESLMKSLSSGTGL